MGSLASTVLENVLLQSAPSPSMTMTVTFNLLCDSPPAQSSPLLVSFIQELTGEQKCNNQYLNTLELGSPQTDPDVRIWEQVDLFGG